MYYISYGSNLNISMMKKRCPNSTPIFELNSNKINKIENYKLIFNKYANIKYEKKSFLPIGLWKITKSCEKNLDLYEGFPTVYKKKYVQIGSIIAMIYFMNNLNIKDPPKSYFKEVVRGYKDFNLDLDYLYNSLNNRETYVN